MLYNQKTKINKMKAKISIHDFDFIPSGYGHYKVTFTSPKTGKKWSKTTCNMTLIDATKNSDDPKVKDLITLRSLCKQ